jgi:hypothetical protein
VKEKITPYELFTGVKPDISNIRTFGCKVYIHNDSHGRGKLDDKAIEGIFMGYGEKVKGYVIYIPSRKRLIHSRNLRFFEMSGVEKNDSDIVELDKDTQEKQPAKLQESNIKEPIVEVSTPKIQKEIREENLQQIQQDHQCYHQEEVKE